MSLHCFTIKVGKGSNKHDLVGEFDIILEISSSVIGLKAKNTGWSAGGQKVVSPSEETKILRIFKILSLKTEANDQQVIYLTDGVGVSILDPGAQPGLIHTIASLSPGHDQ